MNRRLVFVGAHPDDETFGVGGTLALYSAAGVKVYYICGTRGESGTISPGRLLEHETPGDLRWEELQCAASVLGLTDIFHLGYRDSGMPGSPDNSHPEALMAAPVEQVAGRLVKLIRELKPQVVITHDPIGGYRHPDHIAVHNATVRAFHAASDPSLFAEAGAAFQPQKLYYHMFSRRLLRIVTKVMPLVGANPRQFGRNKDIDLASIAEVSFPINASIRLTGEAVRTREKARACHASQVGGGPPPLHLRLMAIASKFLGESDLYTRGYPDTKAGRRERDLFEGVG
jgi:LmbE family N-acetylglucosaminyl deacetylase